MVSTTTATSTYTRTHTATYLSDVLMATMRDVLDDLGISAARLLQDWDQDQAAIAAWIAEGSLDRVVLECHRPSGDVDPVLEFPIRYDTANVGDRAFVTSQAHVLAYLAKVSTVPSGSTFKIFCEFRAPRTPQPGWSTGYRSATDGLRARTVGTLASGPHASASMRLHTR